MKHSILSLFIIGVMVSCNNSGHTHEETSENEHHHAGEITLHSEDAERFGVETSIIKPDNFCETIKVSGKIYPDENQKHTVVATQSGIITFADNINLGTKVQTGKLIATISANDVSGGDDNIKAKITLDNAKREYERLSTLYEDRIVTEKDYLAANEAYQQALNAYKPNTASATSTIAGAITAIYINNGEYVEVGTPIATISASKYLILKADMPEKYANMTIADANFKPSYTDSVYSVSKLNGTVFSQPTVSPIAGYIPVYFKFENNLGLIANSYAEVYLKSDLRNNVIAIPLSALTEEQGDYFVYEKIDAECYVKRLVTIGMSDGYNIEILSGIVPETEIVTKGAVVVKLAANTGAVPGHSHEH